MGAGSNHNATAVGADGRAAGCGFPTCEQDPVTEQGMCELHRRVAISRTGSWLEAS